MRRVPRLFLSLRLSVWPVVGRLLRRPFADIPPVLSGFQAVQQVVGRSFHGLFSGRSPILSVGPAPSGPSGPLVRWSVGSIGAGGGPLMPAPCRGLRPLPASRRRKSVPPPGLAPDEKYTRPEPPARMPTTVPLRTQNPLAQTFSARNIPAQAAPSQAAFTLAAHFGRTSADRYAQDAPFRTHFCRPLRPERSAPDALLQTATPRTLRSGRTSADRYAQNAPLRTHSFGPPRSGCPVQAVPAQAGNSSGWLLT